jgi:long-chain acyl-CoA synthetase
MPQKTGTLTEKLKEATEQAGEKIALQMKRKGQYDTYTYRELYQYAQSVANALTQYGIQKGDRIAIMLENRPEWAFIYFGILLSGAAAVPLDIKASADDIQYFLSHSQSRVIFSSCAHRRSVSEINKKTASLELIVLLDVKPDDNSNDAILWQHFVKITNDFSSQVTIAASDVASIVYTSGTTGEPKGVMLSHQNLYTNFSSLEFMNIFSKKHNILSILPLHHSFPLMVTLLIPIFSLNQATFLNTLSSEAILSCMRETGVTILAGVPQLFYLFYEAIKKKLKPMPVFIRWSLTGIVNLLHQIRQFTGINLNKYLLFRLHHAFGKKLIYFVSGGAKLDTKAELFLNKLGFTIIQGYGLTETSPIVTLNPINQQKIGSVGKAIPNVQLKIAHPNDQGIGEILIKGPNVMQGYYKNEKASCAVLKKSWFHSNDLGYLDPQGYLYLTGRKNELIVLANGKNIAPEEVELHYSNTPYIDEICVFSMPDKMKEKLAAVIVPNFNYFQQKGNLSIEQTIKFQLGLLSKNYPAHKWIMDFVIRKNALPRTRLGKLKRYVITQQYSTDCSNNQHKHRTAASKALNNKDLVAISSDLFKLIDNTIKYQKPSIQKINLDDHLGLDLNFDSLGRIELISSLSTKLSIKIPETLVAEISTVRELFIKINQLAVSQQVTLKDRLSVKKKNISWKDMIQQTPSNHIKNSMDIHPAIFSKALNAVFFNSLYIIFKLCFRLKVTGIDQLPQHQPFILCPNHASYLDAFLIGACLPASLQTHIFFMGYRQYFDVPIIRHFIKIGRIIPIDLSANITEAILASAYVLKQGKAICIFPSGVRSANGEVQPFKKGVGILSKELNVPLVPVYIQGSFDILPIGKCRPKLHAAKIIIGKPMTADRLQSTVKSTAFNDDYDAIAKGIETQVRQLSVMTKNTRG